MTFYFLRSVRETRAQRRLAAEHTRIKKRRGEPAAQCSDDFLLVDRFEKRLGILAMYEEGHVLGF
jgi:hypothetical protein